MAVAFIGRLPVAMNVIGVLTLVTVITGSVSTAAFVSAAQAVSIGIGNPLVGRLCDRCGQRVPVTVIGFCNFLCLCALIFLSYLHRPSLWALIGVCAPLGLTTVPLGALARVRWYAMAKNPPQLATALSYESTADELGFVLGPAAVGIISSAFSPVAPMILSAAIVLLCVIPFGLIRRTPAAQTAEKQNKPSPKAGTVLKAVAIPLTAMCCLGMFFGAMQTSTTAFAYLFEIPGRAGLIYAFMGLGSALTALGAVALPERFTQVQRIITGGLGIMIGAILCSLAASPLVLTVFMFVSGLAIGPASVAIFTLAGDSAPEGGNAFAVTALGSMNVCGVSTASIAAGRAVSHSAAAGYYVAAAAGLIMAAATGIAALQRRHRNRI